MLTVKLNVIFTALGNLTGCRISLYMFGKTEWPPQGDMNKPKESGKVSQFDGNRNVSAGSRNDPGVCGFISPSAKTIRTTALELAKEGTTISEI